MSWSIEHSQKPVPCAICVALRPNGQSCWQSGQPCWQSTPGAIPMPRGRTGQLPVPGLHLVGGTGPLPAGYLFRPTTAVQTSAKGAFRQDRKTTRGTRMVVGAVHGTGMGLGRLLERLHEEGLEELQRRTVHCAGAIPALR